MFSLASIIRLVNNKIFFTDVRFLASPQHPTWRTRISLFVWVNTFDLSGRGLPTSSYTTASLTLQIILPHKPHHDDKVEIPSGRMNWIGCEKNYVNLRYCPLGIFLEVLVKSI